MRLTMIWRTSLLALYCDIFRLTVCLESNAPSFNKPIPQMNAEYRQDDSKNSSGNKILPQTVINHFHGFEAGNFSQHKTRSVGKDSQNYDGFEFVDSPESTTDAHESTGKTDGSVSHATNVVAGGPNGNDGGAIENNSWKRYSNGTIIHDVRISLVHPANMARVQNYDGGSAGSVIANVSKEAEILPSSVNNSKNLGANSTTMAPVEPSEGRERSTGAKGVASDMNATVNNRSTETRQIPSGSYPPPVINLGISINAKGQCISECLTKCSAAEANSSVETQATCLPYCSSERVVENSSTDPLSQASAVLQNETDVDLAPIEIGMLKTKEDPEPKLGFLLEDICLSESCVLKAADILRRMKKSANPCDSFYEFACGGYLTNEIGGGDSGSTFSDISSDILSRMYTVLKPPLLGNEQIGIRILKEFFGKCVSTSPKELFMDALKELGGWPSPYSPSQQVPQQVWGEVAFNWTYGMFLEYNLITVNLTFGQENKWMLNLDYPMFVKMAMNSDSDKVLDEMERDIEIVASALGEMDNSTTRSVLKDLRIFMASAIKYARTTTNAEKGFFTLQDLKIKFTHIDLFKKLPYLLKTTDIADNETIYVSNVMYLHKIDELLRDSTVRTQSSHLVLTALRTLLVLIGTATDTSREKYCVKLTEKLFPQLFGHLYSSRYVSDSKVAAAINIASHVREGLLNMVKKSNNATKDQLSARLSKLTFVWSHRNAINDDLKGIQKGFQESHSFSGYVKTGIQNLKKVTYSYLHQRVNSTLASFIERYSEADYGVNAYYFPQHVLIPYSALHDNFFPLDVPPYVSYSGLGLIVGHELFHSVITYDEISHSADYKNTEKCMIEHFNEFAKKRSYTRVSGIATKEENIADYGGFMAAYRAFLESYHHGSVESKPKRLPGLHTFNEKQMFWLTAATVWCQKVSPNSKSTSADKHAPTEYRIDGQLANIPEFAQDFNCPYRTPMNPEKKCSLW